MLAQRLIIESVFKPRSAAGYVISRGFGVSILSEMAIVVVCIGTILGYIALIQNPLALDDVTSALLQRPLVGAVVQLGMMFVVVLLVYFVGRYFKGRGTIEGAFSIVVWLNAMMLLAQAAQLVSLVLLPSVAGFIGTATAVWLIWAFSGFVGELHGFDNTLLVMAGAFITLIVLFFGVAAVMALIGFTPRGLG